MGKQQRWCFTDLELLNPMSCKATDEFVAYATNEDEGVIIYRNGFVTNRYSDGTIGVPEYVKELVNEIETGLVPIKNGVPSLPTADYWRDVMVDKDGNFVGFL